MLRKIRIALAVLFWLGITLLLLDFTGALHGWLGWMAKVQFLPAVMALNVAVIVGLVLLTLVFGRVYCSVICPLGVFQDGVAHLNVARKRKNKNRKPYSYSPEMKWLRYGVWALFVIALIVGVQALVALLAPYSAWGRNRPHRGRAGARGPAGPVQRLGTHRPEPVPAGVPLGEQPLRRDR